MTAKYTDVFTNASLGWPVGLSVNMPSAGPSPPLAAMGARLRADVSDNLTLWPVPAADRVQRQGVIVRGSLQPTSATKSATSGLTQCSKKDRYSITSSARASRVGDSSRPSALAVLRLTIKSSLVGCSTGISAGLLPRKYFVDLLGGAPEPTTRRHQASWTTTQ